MTKKLSVVSAKLRGLPHRGPTLLPLAHLILLDASVFLIFLVLSLLLQWASGAHSSAFGSEPDESSHYVTGVMVRDYIAHGLPGSPIAFAKDFYIHYPRVAFGLWPPLFHVLSGVWMLVFGVGRMSIMFLLAGLTSTWAFVYYRIGMPALGRRSAVMLAVLLLLLPTTQRSTSAVMPDMAMALMMLLSMSAYASYLETERTKDAFMFGLWSALALLVKYNALALALLPILCVVISGKHRLFRSKSFWLPAAVVLLIAGPWYAVMGHFVLYAADSGTASTPIGIAIAANAKGLFFLAGPIVFVLAVIGSVLVFLKIRTKRESRNERSLYVTAAAMVLAVFVFHGAIYPIYDSRYLLPAAPALLWLSWPSVRYIHSVLSAPLWVTMTALFFLAIAHLAFTSEVPAKKISAYLKTRETVLTAGLQHNSAVLVSADGIGEGMLTAEFVMHDRRPDHYVVRASKVLASQTLMGDKYRLQYQSPEEIMGALDSIPISIVVMETCSQGKCSKHQVLLTETARLYPERWRLSSVIRDETASSILVYQLIGNEGKALENLQIDMSNTLQTTVGKQ